MDKEQEISCDSCGEIILLKDAIGCNPKCAQDYFYICKKCNDGV